MFVPCPHCGFLVALVVSRPDAAQRCPRCQQPLQLSTDGGGDDSDAAAPAPTEVAPATAAPTAPDLEPAASDVGPAPPPGAAPASAAVPARGERGRGTAQARRPASAPSFARRGVSALELGPRWPGVLAIAVLTVLLAAQLLLAQRHTLAADARWRPALATLCNVLRCQLRPWHEPAAFTMLARNVQPAPQRPGVLLVQASFRNDARWPQPWPRLLLRLSDAHGRTVGQRLFTATDYRGQTPAPPAQLAPGQSASVRFAVREPAPDIVAFDFDFR